MPTGAISKVQFPVSKSPYMVTIRDKSRNSGLTSIRFLDQHHLVCCDFNARTIYLVRFDMKNGWKIIHQHPTIIHTGQAAQTDLMDTFGNICVVTNFNQGALSFYAIEDGKIKFLKEVNPNSCVNAHGVRFPPGNSDLVWVSYCGVQNKCAQIIDWRKEQVVQSIDLEEQAQDAAFMGPYILQFARTNHAFKMVASDQTPPRPKMYTTVYLFKTLDGFPKSKPVLLDEWHGDGHIDAAKEYRGRVYATNQYTDTVDVFEINKDKIFCIERLKGFEMPHGLDISQNGVMAVTNYYDQTLRLTRILD